MNINKKLDRVKQWAGEKMGGETRTGSSDEFKMLELEMTLRHEGMERLQKSMTSYIKSISKRDQAEDKEKVLPVAYLGQTMATHGEDFEPDSEYGNCLIAIGRTNERIARHQEDYVTNATSTWLESLERSLSQMKEYQSARKKLENRRLAYDASFSKMQKTKKEDYRAEEELRSQKYKYEESNEDVTRRMEDIKEAEAESVVDLGSFLDAELEYHEKCREELLRLRKNWPAGPTPGQREDSQKPRSRLYADRFSTIEEQSGEPEPIRPSIRSTGRVASARLESRQDSSESLSSLARPSWNRAKTFEGPQTVSRTGTPLNHPRKSSVPSDPSMMRTQLRPVERITTVNVFGDKSDSSTLDSTSPDHSYRDRDRSVSPATSQGSYTTRSVPAIPAGKKAAPPPPPSRSKKPPPPLPMKRAESAASVVGRY